MDPLALKITYEFSRCPTKSKLKELHNFLKNYPLDVLNRNKIIFFNALFIEIRKTSDLTNDCISEILFLLNKCKTFEESKFLCILLEEISNFIQIYTAKRSKTQNSSDFSGLDIGLSLEILKILTLIFSHSNNEKLEKVMYSYSSLLLLGYVVSFLIYHIEYFKERDLQNKALSSLLSIVTVHDRFASKSDIIVNFAPGIFLSLTKLVKADRKIGFSVKSRALDCLGQLITSIYRDYPSGHSSVTTDQGSIPPELARVLVTRDERWCADSWPNVVKIIAVTKHSVLERPDQEHWRVKMALLRLCELVLTRCPSVGSAATDLIECLLVLSADDSEPAVSQEAARAIRVLSTMSFSLPIYWDADKRNSSQIAHSGALLLAMVVRDNLDKIVKDLDRLNAVVSDDVKCNMLRVLDGYLAVFASEGLAPPTCVQVKQIIIKLITLCEMDHSTLDLHEAPVSLVTEATLYPSELPRPENCEFFRKPFSKFHSDKVYGLVRSIMGRLVETVTSHSLAALLQSILHEQPQCINAVLLLTKSLVTALDAAIRLDKVADGTGSNQIDSLCKTILGIYFDADVMDLTTAVNSLSDASDGNSGDFWVESVIAAGRAIGGPLGTNVSISPVSSAHIAVTPATLKSNTLTVSLAIELCAAWCRCIVTYWCPVSNSALANRDLEYSRLDSWLMRTCLFHVMSKSQQSPRLVSHCALLCLVEMAHCHPRYEQSLSGLIRHNADYLMDAIARRLRSLIVMLRAGQDDGTAGMNKCHATCHCLIALCQHAGEDVLPFLSAIISQLLSYLDETHGATNQLFMTVLSHTMKAICRWKQSAPSPMDVATLVMSVKDSRESVSSIEIVRVFLAERNEILVSSGMRKELDTEAMPSDTESHDDAYFTDSPQETQESQKPKASETTVVIRNIARRCINLMAAPCVWTRLACLEMLNDAARALQHDTDELPVLVHQFWEALEHRLWDKQYPVIIRAFELVDTVSQLCPSFLYVKIRSGFVTKLSVLLDRCATISASPFATMKYSGLYRLQASLLVFLSQLSVRTAIHGRDLEQVVDAFLPYLDDRQPTELISICQKSLQIIFGTDPGLVWFKLAQIQSCNLSEEEQLTSHKIYGGIGRAYGATFRVNTDALLHDIEHSAC